MLRQNLIPVPSFEQGVLGPWQAAASNATIADFSATTAWASQGRWSAHLKATNTAAGASVLASVAAVLIPVNPAVLHVFTADLNVLSLPSDGASLLINWIDASRNFLATSAAPISTTGVFTGPGRLYVLAKPPPTAAYGVPFIGYTSSQDASGTLELYFDGVLMEPVAAPDFTPPASPTLALDFTTKSDSPSLPAMFDTGQAMAESTWGGAGCNSAVIGGRAQTTVSSGSTSVVGYKSIFYPAAPLSGPVTRIGMDFTLGTGPAYPSANAGGVDLLVALGLPSPTSQDLKNALHMASNVVGWDCAVFEAGTVVDLTPAVGGFFGTTGSVGLPMGDSHVYRLSMLISGDKTLFQLPDGSQVLARSPKIASYSGTVPMFENYQQTPGSDSRSKILRVWADTSPVTIPAPGSFADGHTSGWQWDGTPGASASRERVPPILKAASGDPTHALPLTAATRR